MRRSMAATALLLIFASPLPAADPRAQAEQMDRQCEAAREARIKPRREMEIAKCKTEQGKDPGYCERFWSDYGNAVRQPNGKMRPRLFDDLPECVAAREAWRKLANKGD
jgi:hypothetical protein